MSGIKYSFQLLGGLKVTAEGETIDLKENLGNQLTSLFAFLLCNYKQSVSKEKIIDTFWQDSENPTNALKFAIYRLRTAIKKIDLLSDIEFIQTSNTGYQFNTDLNIEIDTELFEEDVLTAKKASNLNLYQEAVDLYAGDFLSGIDSEWVEIDRGYYKSVLLQACNALAQSYLETKKVKESIAIAEKGLLVDELDEQLIFTYVKALVQDKRYNYAMSYYQNANKKYIERLGFSLESSGGKSFQTILVKPSDKITKTNNEQVTHMIDLNTFAGPLVLEPSEFKAVCMYELRNMDRRVSNAYIVKMDVSTKKDIEEDVMRELSSLVEASFRKSDVMSRTKASRIVLLLQLHLEKDVEILKKRIQSRLDKNFANKYKIKFEITRL